MELKLFEVLRTDYDGLTSEQKEQQPNNGSGKEYASYLVVKLNGKIIAIESDAMEPEDTRFYRDLSWIKPLVEEVSREQAKLTLQQVIDEIDYCRTLDELKQKLSEALK